jgi:hypothetical protein
MSRYALPSEMGKSTGTGDAFDCAGRIIAPLLLTDLTTGGYYIPFILVGSLSVMVGVILFGVLYMNKAKRRQRQHNTTAAVHGDHRDGVDNTIIVA